MNREQAKKLTQLRQDDRHVLSKSNEVSQQGGKYEKNDSKNQ